MITNSIDHSCVLAMEQRLHLASAVPLRYHPGLTTGHDAKGRKGVWATLKPMVRPPGHFPGAVRTAFAPFCAFYRAVHCNSTATVRTARPAQASHGKHGGRQPPWAPNKPRTATPRGAGVAIGATSWLKPQALLGEAAVRSWGGTPLCKLILLLLRLCIIIKKTSAQTACLIKSTKTYSE